MKLAFNTYVYEVAKWPIEKTLASAQRLGFKYTEYAACDSGRSDADDAGEAARSDSSSTRISGSTARRCCWPKSSTWPAPTPRSGSRCSTT